MELLRILLTSQIENGDLVQNLSNYLDRNPSKRQALTKFIELLTLRPLIEADNRFTRLLFFNLDPYILAVIVRIQGLNDRLHVKFEAFVAYTGVVLPFIGRACRAGVSALRLYTHEGYPLNAAFVMEFEALNKKIRDERYKIDRLLQEKKQAQYKKSAPAREMLLALEEKRDLLET